MVAGGVLRPSVLRGREVPAGVKLRLPVAATLNPVDNADVGAETLKT
jgi:hypothetical protein